MSQNKLIVEFDNFLELSINEHLKTKVYNNILCKISEFRVVKLSEDLIEYFGEIFDCYDIYEIKIDSWKLISEKVSSHEEHKPIYLKKIKDQFENVFNINLKNEIFESECKIESQLLYTSELMTYKEFEQKYGFSPLREITPEEFTTLSLSEKDFKIHMDYRKLRTYDAITTGRIYFLKDSKFLVKIFNKKNIKTINNHFNYLESKKYVIKLDKSRFYVSDRFLKVDFGKFYVNPFEELTDAIKNISLNCNS